MKETASERLVKTASVHQAVWADFRNGSQEAFATIYQTHFSDLYRYGMSIHPNKELVGDAIHDLFIDLWRYRKNLADIRASKFYLLRSLRSKIYRQISANKSFFAHDWQHTVEGEVAHPSHEEWLIQRHMDKAYDDRLSLSINQLPALQREVIRLIFFEKRTYEETAYIMSKKVQTLYTLTHRAIANLRRYMKA